MKKYFKIVYGYGEADYFPITADELHKAFFLSMVGGKAIFENGFFQNRDKDVMRIVPDWHRVKGWNKGWKMTPDDYEDIRPLEDKFTETLRKGKLLAEYIVENKRMDLLSKPASVAFQEFAQLQSPESKKIDNDIKVLSDKFKL